jgi:Microbial transglutaminase/Putative peptidoglycan binding domain
MGATLDATVREVKNGKRVSALDRADRETRAEEPAAASTATTSTQDLRFPSPANVALLQRLVGNRATAAFVRVLARLGTPLDKPLPPGADKPLYGEDTGVQRRYSRLQYHALWEAEQGRRLTFSQKTTIKLGCIGITANNLGVENPPLNEIYSTFAKAKTVADSRNATMERYPTKPWVVFAIHFWSNQDPDETKRESPNPTAFRPDATGKIDMTGYDWLERPGYTNFDYGFWDEVSASVWHANHYEEGPSNPMQVYQSTMAEFAKTFEETPGEQRFGYPDFDREGWGVAQASNYDPTKASRPNLTSPRLTGDATIQQVFKGKTTLGRGSPPGSVKTLQTLLLERGYDLGDYGPAKNGVDGKYGDKTTDAVKKFKADENLGNRVSGRADRGVIMRLDELFPP